MIKPTERFSSRVDNYVNYRPTYPQALIETLTVEYGLTPTSVIADVGSGTGILTALFLRNGNRVFGVEPNAAMRSAGECILASFPTFTSVAATAEATALAPHSVDLVTAAQAFHWFERDKARAEFTRILKPGGWVVLIWNRRRTSGSPLMEAYEQLLLTHGSDYVAVREPQFNPALIRSFFSGGAPREHSFVNHQALDYDGLKGRLLSASYTPEPDQPDYEAMIADLEQVFDTYQTDGIVTLEYDTVMYIGPLHQAIPVDDRR